MAYTRIPASRQAQKPPSFLALREIFLHLISFPSSLFLNILQGEIEIRKVLSRISSKPGGYPWPAEGGPGWQNFGSGSGDREKPCSSLVTGCSLLVVG
jgi:hypothetical protein